MVTVSVLFYIHVQDHYVSHRLNYISKKYPTEVFYIICGR